MNLGFNNTGCLNRLGKILFFSARRYGAGDCAQRAVALTYYTIFAIVPVAAMLFGIAKGFNLESLLRDELTERLWQHKELLEWIYKFADTTLKEAQGGLVAGVGVVALIWTVLWLATNIEKAFNGVWGLPTRKNIFRRFSDYLAIILLTPVVLVLLGGTGVAVRTLFDHLEKTLPTLNGLPTMFFSLGGDLFPVILAALIFSVIYFLVPNTRVRFLPALLAGVVSGVLFQLMQDGFIFLQGHLFRYNRIYGSFAALPLFLIWLQWSWQLILFGAEIGFVAQNIDSGLFDLQGHTRDNQRLRRIDQLVIGGTIYHRFAADQGATSWSDLLRALNRPTSRLENELNELIACGIVFAVEGKGGKRSYLPGYPTDKFTAAELLTTLDGFLPEGNAPTTCELRQCEQLLDTFAAEIQHSAHNLHLADCSGQVPKK